MRVRIASLLLLAATVVAASASGASSPPASSGSSSGPTATAKALSVRIVLPNGQVVGSPAASSDAAGSSAPSFSYPDDGSVVVTAGIKASATAKQAGAASGTADASASNISLFEGEITADGVAARATAAAGAGRSGGAFGPTGVTHLQALGHPHDNGSAALADWGSLTIATHRSSRSTLLGAKSYDGVSIGLDVKLTKAHGGLPAGSEIQIGYAEASAQTAPPEVTDALDPEPGDRPQLLPPATGPLIGVPQVVVPPLTAGTYVYPVYGPNAYSDQYGTSVAGNNYQHGVDLFGRLGQPLLAVTDGTLFQVGWNHTAGNRLWLRDRQGNQFYYSHLSAFTTLTSNGAHVRAGQVIGFMGNTGNASGEPTHLHFEVHPVSLLSLGPDGAVDPGSYLSSWHRLATISFPVATGWAPAVPGTIKAPEPGAMLSGSTDISTQSGLDPASLRLHCCRIARPTRNG